MASKIFYFSGKCKWAKLTDPDPKYQYFGVEVSLDPSSKESFINSGLQLEDKKDSVDGLSYVRFRRPVSKLIKNEVVNFSAPEIIDINNEPFDAKTTPIGNGSTITCKVVVYDSMKGKGHRLEKVRVDDLVEYENNKELEEVF